MMYNIKEKISIVVPCYNAEQFLPKCIDSILHQTYQNIEVCLVDDGSPDRCGEICDEYAQKDNRIKVVHKKNGGLSAARNTGVSLATGDWIMFVDGDDWIEPTMCESMINKVLEDRTLQLVMCEWVKDYNGSLHYNNYKFSDGQVFDGDACRQLQGYMLNFNYFIACAYCKLINRKFLLDNNIFHDEDLRQGVEGVLFNLKLFDKLEKAVFIKQPLYHYIYNDESISVKMTEKTIDMMGLGFQRIDSFIESKSNRTFLEENLSIRVLSGIISAILRGYFGPYNKYTYNERKSKMSAMLSLPVYQKYLKKYKWSNKLSFSKKIVLLVICFRFNGLLMLAGKLRHWQLEHK